MRVINYITIFLVSFPDPTPMSAISILLNHVFPIAYRWNLTSGFFTTLMIVTAPLKPVSEAVLQESLGSINTFPFPMMTVNGLGWIIYGQKFWPGMYIKDPYVVAPNIVVFIFGMWYSMITLSLQTRKSQLNTIGIIITASVMIYVAGTVSFLYYPPGSPIGKNILGIVCVLNLIVFYSSPLSTIPQVIIVDFDHLQTRRAVG